MYDINSTLAAVKDYYGQILKSSKDLKTSACCSIEEVPVYHRDILKLINNEILERFYGCGSPVPVALDGCTVLDLGCGTGRDAYLLSKLVGEQGRVIGLDMTDEQLSVARRYLDEQTSRFGYERPNVEFLQGYIEDLESANIADNSVDLVVSNCVINLSPEKRRVFSEIFRVLKPGGELYFSDVFASRRVPESLRRDPLLHGECLSGALYVEDFRRLLCDLGCADYRVISQRRISLDNQDVEEKAGMIDFCSMTVRAFKLPLEDICEDYGQVATYLGTVSECPHRFALDEHHLFETGRPLLVCGNTADMVSQTRFAKHFQVAGNKSVHFGPFKSAASLSSASKTDSDACC